MKWINAKQRQPKKEGLGYFSESVLALFDDDMMGVVVYDHKRRAWCEPPCGLEVWQTVTHWTRLPPIP